MRVNPNLTSSGSAPVPPARSLLWWTAPVALFLGGVAMLATYALMLAFGTAWGADQQHILAQSLQAVVYRETELYEQQRAEALRLAYTQGIPEALRAGDTARLQSLMEALAQAGDLDLALVTDMQGTEVLGLLRTAAGEDYSVSTGTRLNDQLDLSRLSSGTPLTSGIWNSPRGTQVYTATLIVIEAEPVGVAVAAWSLERLLQALEQVSGAEVSLYDANFQRLVARSQSLFSAPDLAQYLSQNPTPEWAFRLGEAWLSVRDFQFGEPSAPPLALLSVARPYLIESQTAQVGQGVALLAAGMAGASVVGLFFVLNGVILRTERISQTAQALAQGKRESRTGMSANDEIGALGVALDRYADAVALREDKFRLLLRKERRERVHLNGVLEALPDGIIVQDEQARLLMMNERARHLLGAQAGAVQALGLKLDGQMGASLATGIYALGDPQQVRYGGTLLSAQVAAVLAPSQERLGTLIVLRDISQEVQREQERAHLLNQLAQEVQAPLPSASASVPPTGMTADERLARELAKHSASLQKMIVEMRDLTQYDQARARTRWRPLSLETLLIAVANDWRQIAQAADLSFKLELGKTGLVILGDEARLRYALGNLLDNAIKYTPAKGMLSLEIKEVQGTQVQLRVRDNGVGIRAEDLPHLFTPFYRGTPTLADGTPLRVPGMGQGLAHARQIIQAHGGALKVKSVAGQGTAVYLQLPLTSGVSYELPILPKASFQDGDTVLVNVVRQKQD